MAIINKEKIKTKASDLRRLRLEIIQKMVDLATAGFGLVAALAWNEAINSLFMVLFPKSGNIIAKFLYAGLITALVVLVTLKLGKILDVAKKEIEENDKK